MKGEKIVPVVNEKDRILCYKRVRDLGAKDITRVSALWVRDSKGNFLLAKRTKSKTYNPGKWQPAVAGTVEKGETYRQNILKETMEEIGVKKVGLKKGPKMRISSGHEYFVQWFFAKMDKPAKEFKIQRSEVAGIKWFSEKEFFGELKKKNNKFVPSMPKYAKLLLGRHACCLTGRC